MREITALPLQAATRLVYLEVPVKALDKARELRALVGTTMPSAFWACIKQGVLFLWPVLSISFQFCYSKYRARHNPVGKWDIASCGHNVYQQRKRIKNM